MAARRPDFIAYSVTQTNGRNSRWREVGVAFWNRKESALTVLFDAVPLSGRLVLSPPPQTEESVAHVPGREG